MTEFWDPNTWTVELPERRIYLDDRAQVYAIVSEEDYQWALQWMWNAKVEKKNGKVYAKRNAGPARTPVYLHVEIMRRTGISALPGQVLVDHLNGKSLDCRRENLRHANYVENNRNLYGKAARQLNLLCVA